MGTMTVASVGESAGATAREQSRARYPDQDGFVESDGVRVFYEMYGKGEPSVLLLPTWEIVHSRVWKCQVPYYARHGRVVTFDRRGNGRSSRPREVRAYDRRRAVDDALAVLDQAGIERAVVVSWCGAGDELMLAIEHPQRVTGLVLIAPDLLLRDDPAACDLAIVQGGLTTAMELTANRRPFIYFPLKHHFEQNFHVHHRLARYRAGRRMDFDDSPPDAIAQAIAQEIGRDVDYRQVASDGAARAAATIAELLR